MEDERNISSYKEPEGRNESYVKHNKAVVHNHYKAEDRNL